MKALQAAALLSLLVLTTYLPVQAGGPWPPGKGLGFFQAGLFGIPPTANLFDRNGETRLLNRQVMELSFQAYGEYGLSDKLWLTAVLPLKYTQVGDLATPPSTGSFIAAPDTALASGQLFGLSNTELSLKYNVFNKGLQVAVGLGLSAPTGRHDPATELRTGFPVWGLMPQISLGAGFERSYILLDGGFNFRFDTRDNPSQKYSHEWMGNLEFGYRLGKRHYLAAFIHSRFSTRNQPDPLQVHTALHVNNQSYLAWGLKAILALDEQKGFTLSFAGAFAGHLVQAAPGLGLGFYYKLQRPDPFESSK